MKVMTLFELRQMIESAIPWWAPFAAVFCLFAALGIHAWLEKKRR